MKEIYVKIPDRILSRLTHEIERHQELINLVLFELILGISLLARIEIPLSPIGIYFPLVWGVGIITILINFRSLRSLMVSQKLLFGLGLAFYLWIWVSAFQSSYLGTAVRYTVKYSSYVVILLALLAILSSQRDRYQKIAFRFLTLIGLGGVIEVAFPHSEILDLIRYPDHYPRISSIVQGPNQLGVLMAIAAILAIIYLHEKVISRWEFTLTIGIFITLTCLSASVNSWVIFGIGLSLVVLYRLLKPRTVIAIATLWIICLLIFPLSAYRLVPQQSALSPVDRNSTQLLVNKLNNPHLEHPELAKNSASARSFLWKQAAQQGFNKPMTGLGAGVFAEHISSQFYQRTGFHAHNLFLSLFAELGIIGLGLGIAGIVQGLRQIPFQNFQVMIPLMLLLNSQMFDFFINDYTFGAIALYVIADSICQIPINQHSA